MQLFPHAPRVIARCCNTIGLACVVAFGFGSAVPIAAQAASSSESKKAQKKKVAKPKFIDATGETPKQRDARLKRECKGRHNAGACEGYTR